MAWRHLRRTVQVVAFVAFLLAVVYTLRDGPSLWRADILLRLDPLAGLSSALAGRRWPLLFWPAGVLLLATLFLGRFWCGWLCPLGTLLDWTSLPLKKDRLQGPFWRRFKYGVLFLVLGTALWGSLALLIFDPLTIFVRSVSTLLLPGMNWAITQVEVALYRVPFFEGIVDRLDSILRGPLLTYKQPSYEGALFLAAFVGGVLALNLLAQRAWCRYFCPLGAFLALVSKVSWLKRTVLAERCSSCNLCSQKCPVGAIDSQRGYANDGAECILCMDCLDRCPSSAISFRGHWRLDWGWPHDPTRRQVIGGLLGGLGLVVLANVAPKAQRPVPYLLRPPGTKEEELLRRCLRCGACVRICPTHGLQPSLAEAGWDGLWTPVLVPRLGNCEYSCVACGEACPTGAIPQLTLETKWRRPIGKAYINRTLCIAWSGRGDCIVCEEVCPLPEKAVVLEKRSFSQPGQEPRVLQVPVVLHERCVGCGLCENKCPVHGEAAIRVILDPLS
ncbi:MAG: 4Fe-4S dicluster domain-containing protein [Anaerolineae bacterium]|nr:4Fe-4S dicluster domain-containing protein [Anaerolineae bacterium]